MPVEFKGTIDAAGRFTMPPEEKAKLAKWAADNPCKDVVTAVTTEKKRSNRQNNYYWSTVVPIMMKEMNAHGNDFDEDQTHEELKRKFNYKGSTSNLRTQEFQDYLEKIRAFAGTFFQITIPDPKQSQATT